MGTDKITNYLPILGLSLLISGIIKQYAYYDQFGITINDYISFTEASLSFIDDLMELLVLFGFSVCGFVLINYFVEEAYNESTNFELTKETGSRIYLKTLRVILSFIPSTIVIGFAFYFVRQIYLILFSFSGIQFNTVKYMLGGVHFTLLLGCIALLNGINNGQINKNVLIIMIGFVTVYFLFKSAVDKADEVKTFPISEEIKYTINGSTFVTSDTIAFIGKTEKFSFWLFKNAGVRVIPLDNLTEIRIKNKIQDAVLNPFSLPPDNRLKPQPGTSLPANPDTDTVMSKPSTN